MFHVVTRLDAEWNAAEWVATEEAKHYAHAPLVTSTLKLQLSSTFLSTPRAFAHYRLPLAVESWRSHELPLLLCN